jgi:hypothetical protein
VPRQQALFSRVAALVDQGRAGANEDGRPAIGMACSTPLSRE